MTGAITYWARGVLRHRRRAALGLAALAFIAAVVPLVAGPAARRTATSVERMHAELRPYDLDVQFDEEPPPTRALDRIARLPGVEVAAEGASILARPAGTDLEPFQSFGQGGLDEVLGRDFERPRIDAGRLPREADEVLVSTRLAGQLDLHLGDDLVLDTFTPDAIDRIFAGEPATYDGPKVALRVVGIGRQPQELTGGGDSAAPLFVVAPAFFEVWVGKVHWFDGIYLVHLADGLGELDAFSAALRAEFPDRGDLSIQPSEEAARVGDAVSTQSIALALLALAAFATGGLAIGQAAGRAARSWRQDGEVLAALGMDRRRLALARAAVVAVPVIAGVFAAVLMAVVASSLFPTGPAGNAEPDPGIRVDALILTLGAGALITAALAATIVLGRPRPLSPSPRPSALSAAVAGAMPSVAAGVGIRAALRPSRGPTAIPSRSAMVAFGAGVAGLVAAVVFGSSLDRLVHDPARYGWNWDYVVALGDELTDAEALEQARAVIDDPRVEGALFVRVATRELSGEPIIVLGVETLAGGLQPTIVEGHSVLADDQIVHGKVAVDRVHQKIGGTIELDGPEEPSALHIVGQGLFPTDESEDPADGAAVTLATMQHLTGSGGFPNLYITPAPGADVEALMGDLEDTMGFASGVVRPPVITNLELISDAPYLLAAYLGLLGAAVSAHAVLVTIRQRRNELAVLKALGFARRQVATTLIAQSLTIAAIGVGVGLPVGLAAGRLTWRLTVDGLGFGADPHNPLAPLALVGPAALALAVVIAAAPAWWIARARPAEVLRTE